MEEQSCWLTKIVSEQIFHESSRVGFGSVEFSLQRPSPLWESDARRLALKYTLDLFDTFHEALALIAVV